MGLPVWITKAGDLGVIAERQFYQFRLDVTDSEVPLDPAIAFSVVAGELPQGLSLRADGSIEGVPTKKSVVIQGVPLDVGRNETSRFAVRARTTSGAVSDRTFTITVTGQNPPDITTVVENLGDYLDGTYFEYQLEAVDLDPGDRLVWQVQGGDVPPGITLTEDGLLQGYIEPVIWTGDGSAPGFDVSGFDMNPWDFTGQSISKSYKFSVSVFDGKDYDIRTYVINVIGQDSFAADAEDLTSDSDFVTSDRNTRRNPILLNTPSSLGTVLHENYFAFKFEGRDWDGEQIRYISYTDEGRGFDEEVDGFDSTDFSSGDFFFPPNLVLDPDTGWLYGELATQSQVQQDYIFGIQVVKVDDPSYASEPKYVTLTVVTDLLRQIVWTTPSNLGTIENGQVSEFRVEATNPLGLELTYRLKPGATGRLPQGLKLLDNGLIVGRASFSSFFLDGNTTTFDNRNTTFDNTYTFTVNARDISGSIDVDKTFVIRIVGTNLRPYENLYLVSRTNEQDRDYLSRLLNNTDIFQPDLIYRPEDEYFGVSRDLRFLLAYGLNPVPAADYIDAMGTNHYTKNLKFGDIKTARALNSDGTTRYEVVYIEIIDDLANSEQIPVPRQITTSTGITVNPNSFLGMQEIIHAEIGQSNPNVLPDWMTSKQKDGSILNYVHVCILAYVNPGEAERLAFNLNQLIENRTFDFKKIKFDIDRYVWDVNLSKNYNKETGEFNSSAETTFDVTDIATGATTFDEGGTRFFVYNDVYQGPDENDKYLKFPMIGVL